VGNLKRENHFEDLGVDGRVLLKLTNSISNPTYVDVGSVNVYVCACMYVKWI
jgi:hypothetical protein